MGEAGSKKSRGGCSPLLLNLMGEQPSEQDDDEEKTLELSLGLPGGGGGRRTACKEKGRHPAANAAMLSLGYSTVLPNSRGNAKGSPSEVRPPATRNALAVAPSNNSSQTRSPSTPVIGWPPVRTFRRNLANSSKASLEQQNVKKSVKAEETKRAPFVKINMDGIPIGRKIDLSAFDSYDKLCLAVDKLFRHLIIAQNDPLPARTKECPQEEVAISGLLDGTGEYTLVYEDYEGDRVLVGDVPWGMTKFKNPGYLHPVSCITHFKMFVSSVKRLRVLKTSDLSSSLIASGRKRTAP